MVQADQILRATPHAQQAFMSIDLFDETCKSRPAGLEPSDRSYQSGKSILHPEHIRLVSVEGQSHDRSQARIHSRHFSAAEEDRREERRPLIA